jgi:hypothetical protein
MALDPTVTGGCICDEDEDLVEKLDDVRVASAEREKGNDVPTEPECP